MKRACRITAATAALAAALAAAPVAEAKPAGVEAALKGADAPSGQLTTTATSELPGGSVVYRLGQEVGGVPVVGAGAVVVDDAGASPQLLFDETDTGIAAPGDAAISRAAAVRAAAPADAKHVSARQVIVPGGDGTLAWEVTYTTRYPLGDWVDEVDAASGEVLSERNRILNADGHAMLFVPNAVVANDGYKTSDGGQFTIKDNGDADSNGLTQLREGVALDRIKDGQTCLRGDWVSVRLGAKGNQVCKDTLNWDTVTRRSNKFEALMAYHHVDRVQDYIQTLGLDPINEESQKVTVDSIPDDNSFYQPSSDRITMGRGGVDDAEDADVIVHEYGHAVQDAQNPGAFRTGGNQTGAMGEGFGDYLSQAYSTERVGYDGEWSRCVMEWDATSYDNNNLEPPGICLRRADNPRNVADQHVYCSVEIGTTPNEIHCMGEIWASALSDLRQQLGDEAGQNVMDTVVLASHFDLPLVAPQFEDGAEALLKADDSIYPDGSNDSTRGDGMHCAEIRAEMVERQFLPPTFSCT